MPLFFGVELAQSVGGQLAGRAQGVEQDLLGIGQGFDPGQRRQIESHLAGRVAGCGPDGFFVDQQPGLCHAHRDDSHEVGRSLQRGHGLLDFFVPVRRALLFCVAVDEQQIARKLVQCAGYAFFQRSSCRQFCEVG